MKRKPQHWRADANRAINRALSRYSKSTQPNSNYNHSSNRSVARQLFELRSQGIRVERTCKRKLDRERLQRSLEKQQRDAAIDRYVAKTLELEPQSLEDLCVQCLVAQLCYVDSETETGFDMGEYFSFFPANLKLKVLNFAAAEEPGLVNDSIFRALVEPSMKSICLARSSVSDAFLEVIEPKLGLHTPDQSEFDSWDEVSLDTIKVEGMVQVSSLDLSFCENISFSDTFMEVLHTMGLNLKTLRLAGVLNETDAPTFNFLRTLNGKFSSVEVLDLSCCFWLSLDLLFTSEFVNPKTVVSLRSLRYLIAEECPDITKLVGYLSENPTEMDDLLIWRENEYVSNELKWTICLRSKKQTGRIVRIVTSFILDESE